MIDYLGDTVHQGRLEIASHATGDTRNLNLPRTKTELRSFTRLCNVFHRLVSKFVDIVPLLTAILRKSQTKELGKINEEELTTLWPLK